MYLLYDILLHLSLILLLPYFLFQMVFAGKYRKGILERFGYLDKEKLKGLSDGVVVWCHAVSVGETKAVLPLVRSLKANVPDVKVVFSTVTSTGNAVALQDGSQQIDSVVYFPLDFYWVVSRFVNKTRPKVFIAVEKEIWPNILRVLKGNNIPVVVINGFISERSFARYRFFEFFFKRIFGNISCFMAQTKEYAERAAALGVDSEKVAVTGNMKFDIEPPQQNPAEMDSLMQRLKPDSRDSILIGGSTHEGEEELLLDVFRMLKMDFPSLRLILAPRHPERFNRVEGLVVNTGFSLIRRSEIKSKLAGLGSQELKNQNLIEGRSYDVILLDTIGELHSFYCISDIAFVGGSLVGIGGHNLLEPAFYKKPVVYGPYIKTCLEMAVMLEKAGGGIRVNDKEELFKRVREMLHDDDLRKRIGDAAYSVIEANRGATEKNIKIIESYLH